jgi:Isocitrate/isopropylmalate dehydrogenase
MDYMKQFESIVAAQLARIEKMKESSDFIDYQAQDTIIIGIIGGDGIGPAITANAHKVLTTLLADEVAKGKVAFRVIDGLTIEKRAAAGKAIPEDVLAEIKKCHVLLKGPMWPCEKNWICSRTCGRSKLRIRVWTGHFSEKTPNAFMPWEVRVSQSRKIWPLISV